MAKADDLDLKLLSELKKDGSISIPLLAKKLNINAGDDPRAILSNLKYL